MDIALTGIEKQLADFMSDISEDAYCSSWNYGLEYTLWDAVLNGECRYARHYITKENIEVMIKLSNECGCWIYFDDEKGQTPIPLDEWRKKFNRDISKNFRLIDKWGNIPPQQPAVNKIKRRKRNRFQRFWNKILHRLGLFRRLY
nr:hypothetical protein [uncultured Mucilaginibacter sp.]